MTENMKSFLEAVSKNETLIAKVGQMDKDGLTALAKDLGFELTEDDFASPKQEMDNTELEAVVGGERICSCAFGGGGKAEGDLPACACVVAGFGKDDGDGLTCICPVGGYGGWWTLGTQ